MDLRHCLAEVSVGGEDLEVNEEARVVFECLVLVSGKLLLLFSETGGKS